MNGISNLGINALFSLNGKVALITGGSRGIGRMMTQGLLQAGARVYISARNEQACRAAAEELGEFGECFAIPADIASAEGRGHLCRALQARESQLDILINNAGTAWGADFETYPDSAFEKLMNLNVTAVFALTRDLTPLLVAGASQAAPARVINIGSIDGLHIPTVHRTGTYAYTASKAAVHHLTRHLAVELGPKFITVNAVAPGFFPSKMTDHVLGEFAGDVAANSLLKRAGQAEEMAGIAIYLSSRAGAFTHGTIIPIDGGTSINQQHVITD